MSETKCIDCGRPCSDDSWIETCLRTKDWERILQDDKGGGILCISCISHRLVAAGVEDAPVILCGTSPLRQNKCRDAAKENQ